MDWDALGALGEITGALAVIVSLIYVGYQVRLNTAERRVESVRSLTDNLRQLALVYVNNEQAPTPRRAPARPHQPDLLSAS